MPFQCSICEEESTRICARCTKDACNNHICERCLRCSDCCECEVTLNDGTPTLPKATARSAILAAASNSNSKPDPEREPEPPHPPPDPDPFPEEPEPEAP